jgi:hypothetical protein
MDVALLPVIPTRSSSLPISPDDVHGSPTPCYPSRHGSAVMVVADSTSPPSSPRSVLIRPKLSIDIDPQSPCVVPVSEHCPPISPPQSPPHSLPESAPDQEMDRDDVASPVQPPASTIPPVRLLHEEEEHLHQSLRLQDFEVRGTLGATVSHLFQPFHSHSLLQVPVPLVVSSSSNTALRLQHQQIQPDFLQ